MEIGQRIRGTSTFSKAEFVEAKIRRRWLVHHMNIQHPYPLSSRLNITAAHNTTAQNFWKRRLFVCSGLPLFTPVFLSPIPLPCRDQLRRRQRAFQPRFPTQTRLPLPHSPRLLHSAVVAESHLTKAKAGH